MADPIFQNEDHYWPNFEWLVEPRCCEQLKWAVEEQFVFVGNFVSEESNVFYMMPLAHEGLPVRDSGVTISHCPWCGVKIAGKKKYPEGRGV